MAASCSSPLFSITSCTCFLTPLSFVRSSTCILHMKAPAARTVLSNDLALSAVSPIHEMNDLNASLLWRGRIISPPAVTKPMPVANSSSSLTYEE